MSQESLIWLRGRIVPQSSAQISVLSPMAQFGLNVFEGIRCYWNEREGTLYAFRLHDHLTRLTQSCRLIRIEQPYAPKQIESFLRETLEANEFRTDIAVRLTMFVDGVGSWSASEPVSMFIAPIARARTDLTKIPSYRACISSWQRINDNNLPPRAKVGANYINGRYAHLQARHDGYDLPIFLGVDGKVSEGAGACLFMLRGGTLITPTTTSSVLESITRSTVLELAQESGLTVRERSIDRTELYFADEVFLCGTAAEISPIVSIDGYIVGDGSPGKATTGLLRRYLEVASGDDASHTDWRSAVRKKS